MQERPVMTSQELFTKIKQPPYLYGAIAVVIALVGIAIGTVVWPSS